MRESAGLYRLATRVERWAYRNSEWVVTVARPMAEYVAQYVDAARVWVVYNGVDEAEPCSRLEGSSRQGRPRFCIAYAGNVGLVQGLDVLPKAVAMLPSEVREMLHVRIIGGGPRLEALRSEVHKLGVGHVFTFEGT